MNLPTNRDAELSVIGCCLDGGLETTLEAVETIPPSAFFCDDTRAAFALLEEMSIGGREISVVSFDQTWRKLHKSGLASFQQILNSTSLIASPQQLSGYAEAIIDALRRRKIIELGTRMAARASNANVDLAQVIAECEEMLKLEGVRSVPSFDGKECATKLVDDLERRFNLAGQRSGLTTGFHELDEITDGLQAGEQAILAARPSIGKSALAGNIIERICLLDKIPTLFVTLEMSTEAIMRRLLASWARIPMGTLRRGCFNEAAFQQFAEFQSKLKDSPLTIAERVGGVDINELTALIRRQHRLMGTKFIVVDYLQRVRPSKRQEKRTYEVAEVSGALKALAVETKTAFLTVAQLNRESEKERGRNPRLSDLADSGQIERDADLVLLLHRKLIQGESQDAKLMIAKQRDGEIGCLELHFDGQFCKFSDPPKQ